MTLIPLDQTQFSQMSATLATQGAISVQAFRYPSGVAALEIRNAVGRIIALPFQGQQIWDAEFHGRRLTMESKFPHPIATRDYRATNGGFLVHCGGTAMGNPSPEDSHPLHGELPNLLFDKAELECGHQDGTDWVELRGRAREETAEGHILDFCPSIRLTGTAGLITVGIDLRNAGTGPMPLMYLTHVNFRPMDGARLEGGNTNPLAIRRPRLTPDAPEEDWLWQREVAADLSRHTRIRSGDRIVNEFVATFPSQDTGDGWAEHRQSHPDGRCDLVRHSPGDLTHTVRWMVRADHRQACGFAMPGTAAPDGLSAARRTGDLRIAMPGEGLRTSLVCGACDG